MVEVRAELIGNVWKIEAAVGDEVEADSVILILESMKMEVPAMSPVRGVVAAIHVVEGESVAEHQLLAEVQAAEA